MPLIATSNLNEDKGIFEGANRGRKLGLEENSELKKRKLGILIIGRMTIINEEMITIHTDIEEVEEKYLNKIGSIRIRGGNHNEVFT